MTKQNEQEALGTAMNKTEMFFEKNSKSMIIALLALFVLAAAIFGYRQLISQPRERKAAEMIAQAQYRFESTTPEYQLALEGDRCWFHLRKSINTIRFLKRGGLCYWFSYVYG